jgi:hypothetical protein
MCKFSRGGQAFLLVLQLHLENNHGLHKIMKRTPPRRDIIKPGSVGLLTAGERMSCSPYRIASVFITRCQKKEHPLTLSIKAPISNHTRGGAGEWKRCALSFWRNPDIRVEEISIGLSVPFTVICPTHDQFSCRGLPLWDDGQQTVLHC